MFKSWIFKIYAFKKYDKIITKARYVLAFHQNRTRIDLGIMFWKNVVLYEIYSKTLQWPNTFCTSLYLSVDTIFQSLWFISFLSLIEGCCKQESFWTKGSYKSSLRKFYGRHHDLVDRYGISVSLMTTDMFHLS